MYVILDVLFCQVLCSSTACVSTTFLTEDELTVSLHVARRLHVLRLHRVYIASTVYSHLLLVHAGRLDRDFWLTWLHLRVDIVKTDNFVAAPRCIIANHGISLL